MATAEVANVTSALPDKETIEEFSKPEETKTEQVEHPETETTTEEPKQETSIVEPEEPAATPPTGEAAKELAEEATPAAAQEEETKEVENTQEPAAAVEEKAPTDHDETPAEVVPQVVNKEVEAVPEVEEIKTKDEEPAVEAKEDATATPVEKTQE